ncbi:MAG TPA: glycoside hydrolase family 9 protein [Vicinamibacteria bacterium]
MHDRSRRAVVGLVAAALLVAAQRVPAPEAEAHVRLNLVGYRPADSKRILVFAERPLPASAAVLVTDGAGHPVLRVRVGRPTGRVWGRFLQHYEVELGALRAAGRYSVAAPRARAVELTVTDDPYRDWSDILLEFLRQQRCGYNPFLDAVCHPFDGRTAYGPLPPGSYLDVRGGWHDAGDQLKYLLTASNATGQMLMAYRLAPRAFADRFDALGRPGSNGDPDVLDEARWGLEWMLKLHPAPDQLYTQVADDRDHIGWKLPPDDQADYGWGKGGYRVVYFADGRPQGLGRFASASTGIANLAGRYAAAMALAHQVWKDEPRHALFASRCLQAGMEVYRLGRSAEGVQQGNSYGAPYRYGEETWADDMEWGAAELFASTGDRRFLDDAVRYARLIGSTSVIGRDAAEHYQFYPFMNLGHFALHRSVGPEVREELAGYYREGLEAARRRAAVQAYGVGVPFIWCSNNLVAALATQAMLYERMTGNGAYRPLAEAQRDWLLGRNPWAVSMFTGVPEGAGPRNPHLSTTSLTGRLVRGGLVDGPVYARVFEGLKGVTLSGPDLLAPFQGEAVYHDDVSDYSSNEPTMDGTASAVLLFALLAGAA